MEDRHLVALLADLAGAEEDLAAARAALDRRDQRVVHLRELLAEYDDAVAEAGDTVDELAADLRRQDAELRELGLAIEARLERAGTLTDGRQIKALNHEVEGLRTRLNAGENAGLELLERLDEAQAAVNDLTAEADVQAAQNKSEIASLEAKAAQAVTTVGELEGEIGRLLGSLPDPVRRQVERLHQRRLPAVVRVVDGHCDGCGGQLPAQQAVDAAKGRRLVRCAQCASFVVHGPWSGPG